MTMQKIKLLEKKVEELELELEELDHGTLQYEVASAKLDLSCLELSNLKVDRAFGVYATIVTVLVISSAIALFWNYL